MFKDHILVAEALSRNSEECREDSGKYLCRVFGEVSGTTSGAELDKRACTVLYRSQ